MYLKHISVKSYGPIENLSYSFREDEKGNPVPLAIIGKNGCGKTLLFANIVDMFVEMKRQIYPQGILEVNENNYYKVGNLSYIKSGTRTSEVKLELLASGKKTTYIDVMSLNPKQAIEAKEVTDTRIQNDQKFKDSGFYKSTDLQGLTSKEFEKEIILYFPFDRFYKPFWYNPDNYNKMAINSSNNIGYSKTNIIKIDLLENIKEWFRTVHLQTHLRDISLPNHESLPPELRGKIVTMQQDTKLQTHLKTILATIKGDGSYSVSAPNRNLSTIGLQGPSIHCADISQLSAGELSLFAIALSIVREWDLFHTNDSLDLSDITGCVLIDEADVNLHIDFAYRALPALMKLFPRVQFILSTHSPFLLSGLKKEYGKNIDILSLPDGILIEDLNAFSEITTAYEVFNAETDKLTKQLALLKKENERVKALSNKIMIYTEGKTDVKYLKLAFEKLDGFDDIKDRIEYYDIEHAKDTGDGELEKIYAYLQKGNDTNIKICMFDRDKPKYTVHEPYVCGENNVYKFSLQVPSHRDSGDLISVEHCLTDEALKTIDTNGRRIFLSGEFGVTGITSDGLHLCHHRMGTNPLEIIDGSNDKKVYSTDGHDETNYALTKDDFVQHIIDNDPGFDMFSFEGFRPTLEIIKSIVEDADRN